MAGYIKADIDASDSQSYSSNEDIFLIKYNEQGTQQWIRQIGTASKDIVYNIELDTSNNIYLVAPKHTALLFLFFQLI